MFIANGCFGVARRLTLAAAAFALSVVAAPVQAESNQGAWPQFGRDHGHSFYSADPGITVSGASRFGVKWMANLFSADLGSPVVSYNTVLHRSVVYVGNNRADVVAVDATTGQPLWSTNVGLNDKMQATPMVAPDGTVWVATSYNPTLYKLDGATGAVLCSTKSPSGLPINGSPMVVTPKGGVTTVYWDTIDAGTTAGPVVATRESDCKTLFTFTKYLSLSGPWVTPAYGVSATGEPLVVFGTADTDTAEYAIDANTGNLVWDYVILNPPPGVYDIGDAATISPPGANGFADGVVYVDSKYGREYAIDLTTGKGLWQFVMSPNESRASAALDGNDLVVGYTGGAYALNAVTGTQLWHAATPAEVISSPAIVGPAGAEVVALGDVTGAFRLLALANGSEVYKYQTGGFITASPAESNAQIFEASSDGFLYAYGVGGSNSAPPATQIASPANLSQIPNPNGNLTIGGTSTDPTGVAAVEVAIQSNGTAGLWYNATTGTYQSAPVRNAATVANPGSTSTGWSIAMAAPPQGGTFTVFANSVNSGHIVDRGANSNFTMLPSKSEPNIVLSSAFVAPGSTFTARATAFKPNEPVTFTLLGATVATATATSTGYVPNTLISVPSNATFGATSLTLTGNVSGKITTATVGITNNWNQIGRDAMRSAFEPNDPVIADTIDIGQNGTVLKLAWNYATGAAVNSSPAVVDGVAYVGNDAGALSAVVTNTGAPKWNYTTPSHAPIHSSPVVDTAGNVLFGSDDGNVYKVTAAGTLSTSVSLGGKLTSASDDNGQFVIASDNGHIYALSDKTLKTTWSASASGPVHSAPAYDSAANTVVTGDDGGAVTAFNGATGSRIWTFSTGGAVTASPLVSGKVVYVGSASGNFYALDETTGAVKWQFHADAPITAGASLFQFTTTAPITITFGTKAGTVYRFNLAGSLISTLAPSAFENSPVVGVASVLGDSFALTSSGLAGMTRINAGVPFVAWKFHTQGSLSTVPAIVDGAVFIGAGDGNLYAFTPHGVNPVPAHKAPVITITNAWTCTTQP